MLRALFEAPARLRPRQTTEQVTELAAREFARLAESLRSRGEAPEASSRFLIRLLFCLFAEDVGLLPAGLFTRLVANLRNRPAMFTGSLRTLFGAMAEGGVFGADVIAHFNGGLFADDAVLSLSAEDLGVLGRACVLDWKSIEPAIFGTLFERSLDPAKRSQRGAHYTGRGDILLIVEPVLMAPLETYPFPWPPGKEPEGDPRVGAIAEAARDLVEKRGRWLNPEGASEAVLKKRTLTNLYNECPTWLALNLERVAVPG